MKSLIVKAFEAATGKPCSQLEEEWQWHYFCTRSRAKSYYRLLVC